MSYKQVSKIAYGRWKDKDDNFIINKIEKSKKINNTRINYHLGNKVILENESNYRNILVIRLAVTEDMISTLRREKLLLRKRLEGYDDEMKHLYPEKEENYNGRIE